MKNISQWTTFPISKTLEAKKLLRFANLGKIFLEKLKHALECQLLAGFVVVRTGLAGEGMWRIITVKLKAFQFSFQLGFQRLPLIGGGKSFGLWHLKILEKLPVALWNYNDKNQTNFWL